MRAASRPSTSRLPSTRHALDGGRVVDVAPGGHVGQQQVVAAQGDQHLGVVLVEAHTGPDVGQQAHAVLRVVAGLALADVVEQACQHQQVGAGDPAHQGARATAASHR